MISFRQLSVLAAFVCAAQAHAQVKLKNAQPVRQEARQVEVETLRMGGIGLGDEQSARRFTVEGGYINYKYDEPSVMDIKGALYELHGDYRHPLDSAANPMHVRADVRYAFGSGLNYTGGLQNLQTGEKSASTAKSKDSILDIKGLFGTSIMNDALSNLEVYGGLGRWQLNNKISGTGSYAREAIYLYLPMGLNFSRKLEGVGPGTGVILSAGLEYDVYLSGQTTSKMSDIAAGAPDIVHTQSSGSGYTLRVGSQWDLSNGMALLAGAYYRKWDIDPSDVVRVRVSEDKVAGLIEPKNDTTMLGLNAGLTF